MSILEIIFTLSLQNDAKIEHVEQMYDYLVKTQFQGILNGQERYHQISDSETVNQSKIADLGILTFLAMIRIDMLAQGKKTQIITSQCAGKIMEKMKSLQLGPLNSIICQAYLLASRDVAKAPADFEREVFGQRSIESIDHMLRNSFLFTEPGH